MSRNRWLSLKEERREEWQRRSLTLWQSLEWERGWPRVGNRDRPRPSLTAVKRHSWRKFYEDESWYCSACSFLSIAGFLLLLRTLFIVHLIGNNWCTRWDDVRTNGIFSLDIEKVNIYEKYKSFFVNAGSQIKQFLQIFFKWRKYFDSYIHFRLNFHEAEILSN